MKSLCLAFLQCITPCLVYSQNSNAEDAALAQQQIQELKGAVLLIRLKTRKASIEALEKAGKTLSAKRMKSDQMALNREIVAAFKSEFNFCPTYFFYSDFSDQVRAKNLSEVEFLNAELEHDPSLSPETKGFYTAEIGFLEQDTASYYSSNDNSASSNSSETDRYYGSANMGFEALRIMSDQFVQLKKPFPYYVRRFGSFSAKRKPAKMVKLLNKQLHQYAKQ